MNKASSPVLQAETHSARRVSSGTILVVLTILVGISVSVFGIYELRGWKRPSASFENFKAAKLTAPESLVTAAVSPDGRELAYVTGESGKQILSIRKVGSESSSTEIVPASEGDYQAVSFSQNGKFIYFTRSFSEHSNTVFRVPTPGGAVVKIKELADGPISLAPDGKHLAYLRAYPDQKETALIVTPIEGSSERKLAVLKYPSGFVIKSGPAWSPDGKRIAAVGKQEDVSVPYQHLLIVDVAASRVSSLEGSRWHYVERLVWLSDGNSFVVIASDQDSAGAQIWQVSYPSGQSKRITNDPADYKELTVTRDSRQLVAIRGESQANIWVAPAVDESKAIQITSGNGDGFDGLTFAPDGRICYSVLANGEQNLWMMDSDGKNARQLTNTRGINRTPVVSPDGNHLVFASNRSGAMHLWRIGIDGSNPVEITGGVDDAHPQITPDGKWIIYLSSQTGIPTLFRVSIEGGESFALTDRISGPPVISPDGKFIACSYREVALAAPKLAVISIDGGAPVKRLDRPPTSTADRWTREGKALTYLRTIAGTSNLWRQFIEGGPGEQLTHFTSDLIFATDWSRDGRRIIYSKGRMIRDAILLTGM